MFVGIAEWSSVFNSMRVVLKSVDADNTMSGAKFALELLFATTFILIRGCWWPAEYIRTVQTCFEATDHVAMRFTVVIPAMVGVIVALNTYWAYLILAKCRRKLLSHDDDDELSYLVDSLGDAIDHFQETTTSVKKQQ